MGKNKFLCCFFLLFPIVSSAELSCSANGTKVFYLNGIAVKSVEENVESSKGIDRKIINYKAELDKNANVSNVDGIYNFSTGLFDDIRKLREQLLLDADGDVTSEKRRKHFEELIKAEFDILSATEIESFNKSLDYIYNAGDKDSLKYADGNFTDLQIYEDLKKMNGKIADLVAIAASDRQVVTQVKKKISESILTKNQKVIFIAHSQGNEALRTSYTELRNEMSSQPENLTKLDNIFGTLHVASPSPIVIAGSKSRAIKLDTDLVIKESVLFTKNNTPIAPSYTYDPVKTSNTLLKKIPIIGTFFDSLFTFLTSNFFHEFDNIYLNEKIYARSIASNSLVAASVIEAATMTEIFRRNIVEVAESLGDNCSDPIVNLSYIGKEDASGTIVLDGSFGDVKFSAQDTNPSYDGSKTTFTWSVPGYAESTIPNFPWTLRPEKNSVFPNVTSAVAGSMFYENEKLIETGADITFNVPFKAVFNIVITAKNIYGRPSTITKKVKFLKNTNPTVTCFEKYDPLEQNTLTNYVDCWSQWAEKAHLATVYICIAKDDSQYVEYSYSGQSEPLFNNSLSGARGKLPDINESGIDDYAGLVTQELLSYWVHEFPTSPTPKLTVKDLDGGVTTVELPNKCIIEELY